MVLRHLVPSFFWTVLIVMMYSLPGSSLPSESNFLFIPLDKAVHFSVFALYAGMLNVGIAKQISRTHLCNRASMYAAIITGFVGIVLELIQGTVFVDRYTDFGDLTANLLGVCFGVVIFKLLYNHQTAG